MKIQFCGAAREVTGSKHLITTDSGVKILLDCGMYQGKGTETDKMNRNLGFNPQDIDYVILSHAHIDHSGLVPYLYREGFRGRIFCTPATRDLCSIMLADSAHIQDLDATWYNKKMARQHRKELIEPIYEPEDAERCMHLFRAVRYDEDFRIEKNITLRLTRSGHMLGAAVINLTIEENNELKRIAFTGDIGRPAGRLVRHAEPFPQCDYLITESTYGDRRHPETSNAEEALCKVVDDTCNRRKGKLIIPSFSIGRTQEIVFSLNNLYNEHRLPTKIHVYVDSPLAVNATKIFSAYLDEMNEEVQYVLQNDPDPFGFNSLTYISKAEDSKRLNDDPTPSIIISASGMLEAGRVKHHVANHIEDSSTTIMMVGYCSPTTLGARIQQPNIKEVSILGIVHPVRAQITKIEGFSGHADYVEMRDFFSCQKKEEIKKTFLVHGEYESQRIFKGFLEGSGYQGVEIPKQGEEFEL